MFSQGKINSTQNNNKLLHLRFFKRGILFNVYPIKCNFSIISRKCFLVEGPHMFRLFNNSRTIYQNLTTMPAAKPWLVSCATIVRQTADCYGNPINAQFIIVCPYSHVGVLLSLELNSSFVWNVRILNILQVTLNSLLWIFFSSLEYDNG